jgi:hypothetical protein
METRFTLWSLKDVLTKIPFDKPVDSEQLTLDFSGLDVPYYVKTGFKVLFVYNDSIPYAASCSIYSPKDTVVVVIVMRKQYEEAFKTWLESHDPGVLDSCCLRRELYCHEICHLIAIIRAFPSDRSSKVREDFIARIKEKFSKSVNSAEELKPVPISMERLGASPSAFDKDHFRYDNDGLNYFRLYQELMLNYEKMIDAVQALCSTITGGRSITLNDIAQQTLVPRHFFQLFPEKFTALQELLAEEINRQTSR